MEEAVEVRGGGRVDLVESRSVRLGGRKLLGLTDEEVRGYQVTINGIAHLVCFRSFWALTSP